jgi:hypothetical protein
MTASDFLQKLLCQLSKVSSTYNGTISKAKIKTSALEKKELSGVKTMINNNIIEKVINFNYLCCQL